MRLSAVHRARGDEPLTLGRIGRLVGSAVCTFAERFCAATVGWLSAANRSRLDDLVAEDASADEDDAGGGGTFIAELKADPGASLDTCNNCMPTILSRTHCVLAPTT